MTLAQGRLDPPLVGRRRLIVVFILTVAADRLRTGRIRVVGALSLLVCFTSAVDDDGCSDDGAIESFAYDTHDVRCRVAVVCRVVIVGTSSDTGTVDIVRKRVATTSLRTRIVSHRQI